MYPVADSGAPLSAAHRGRFDSLEDLNSLILQRQGDSVVRLDDVATVVMDHYPVRQISHFNGNAVIMLAVRRKPAPT